MPDKTNKKIMKKVMITLTDKEWEKVSSSSIESGLPISEIIRRILDQYYEIGFPK